MFSTARQGFVYEPEWDGFECLVFRDGAQITVPSRKGDDLSYCFLEITKAGFPKSQEPANLFPTR